LNRSPGLLAVSISILTSACQYSEAFTDVEPVEGAGGSGGNGATPGNRSGGSGGRAPNGTGGSPAGTGGGTGAGAGGNAVPAQGGSSGSDAATPSDGQPAVDSAPAAVSLQVTGAATWRGNATAAYSIVHEVVCDQSVLNGPFTVAQPELTMRNLRGGFGLIVNRCEAANVWQKVKEMVANGHDVFSNTFNHRCLTTNNTLAMGCDSAAMRTNDFATEIDRAAMMLEERTGVKPGFILFPYDVCDPGAVARAKTRGYVGARCAQGMNNNDFADPFKVAFDLWGPAWSTYRSMGTQCMGVTARTTRPNQASATCRQHVLSKYVEDAIAKKAWAMRGFHGFDSDNGSFEPVSPADYRTHLDFVVTKVAAGQLWVDGPSRVVRYRMARQHCTPPTATGAVLTFGAPSADCSKHATELSYLITTEGSDPATLALSQAGQRIEARKLGAGSFVVDLDPTKGDATAVP
jgi:hypothetical protein